MLKKNLAQAIAHQQIMPNLKVRKKIYAPKNCPNPPQKNYGLSLKSIMRDTCTSLARFAKFSFWLMLVADTLRIIQLEIWEWFSIKQLDYELEISIAW